RRVLRRVSLSPCCFIPQHGDHLDPHSFPTRRSSDLTPPTIRASGAGPTTCAPATPAAANTRWTSCCCASTACSSNHTGSSSRRRSEEHTSELQSRENLVCRLLLEKKKPKSSGSPTRL